MRKTKTIRIFQNALFASLLTLFLLAISAMLQAEETADYFANKNYIGTELCSACHRDLAAHWGRTTHARIFLQNPGNEIESRGCEACHGPGSEHISDPVKADGILRFTNQSGHAVGVQNRQCLQCHQGGNRIHWMSSVHERFNVGCSDCHNPMANFSSAGLLAQNGINETCFMCHQDQRSQFRRRSHMPLLEGKITCTDCHNPHGSTTRALLKTDTVNQTCYQCHAEKRGPFLFEHAPVRDNCLNCHSPHGSNHEKLLITARPMLCQQCHTALGHVNELLTRGGLASGSRPDPRLMGRSCQNCHAQIHGSNHPSGARLHR